MTAPRRVTHVLWRLSRTGGVQTVVRTLVAAADPERVRLTVVTARPLIAEDGLDELGTEVVPLGHAGSRLSPWRRVRLCVAAARAVRRSRPHVVQLHSGTVWLGALVPFVVPRAGRVVEVHDAPGSGRHRRATDRLEGWWIRLARATVVCHSSSVETEVRRHWRVTRIRRFPLAADLPRFAPDPARRAGTRSELGLGDRDVVGITVARLVPSKRVDLVVEATARTHGMVLLVVGDGPEREHLTALAEQLGVADRVRFLGQWVKGPLGDVVRAADIAVSGSDYEGFGLVLVEAMAAGLPVVATSVGGVVDVVVDGVTGCLVPAGDAGALADVLGTLVADPALRVRLGAAGRQRALGCFGTDRLAAAFTDLYEGLSR